MSYRIRPEGELLVLQVYVPPKASHYGYNEREGTWRDATIHDIPVADPFAQPQPQPDWVTQHICRDVGPG